MLKKIVVSIIIVCFFAGCRPSPVNSAVSQNIDDVMTKNQYILGDLTEEQKLEDYEYMWTNLKASFPFFGVASRLGIDVSGIEKEYEEKIIDSHNDVEFLKYINDCISNFTKIGHLSVLDPQLYEYVKDTFKDYPMREAWYNVINNEKTEKLYLNLLNIEKEYANIIPVQTNYTEGNVITRIIVPGEIAYMKINTFLQDFIQRDYEIIIDFLREVSSYKNLIIDITDNGGGSDNYWMQNIVAPLIKDKLSFTQYLLFTSSPNNDPYLNDSGIFINSKSIDELPYFKNINKDDLKQFTNFFSSEVSVEPDENSIDFNGKIWTLINNNVYSASDSYSEFCANTHFSTLVGENTGGDGIGIDPVYLILPNSGVALRYSMLYGLNLDGSSNQEFGTTPDFKSPDGESPLDTCLKLIERNN
ncbi:MAG: S41 family peptidase [Oscillospiraceae bacterium]|nr:S41 family peptidase [Oscillospiraceae bacterium]